MFGAAVVVGGGVLIFSCLLVVSIFGGENCLPSNLERSKVNFAYNKIHIGAHASTRNPSTCAIFETLCV